MLQVFDVSDIDEIDAVVGLSLIHICGQCTVGVIHNFFPQTFDMYIHGSGISDVFVSPDVV